MRIGPKAHEANASMKALAVIFPFLGGSSGYTGVIRMSRRAGVDDKNDVPDNVG